MSYLLWKKRIKHLKTSLPPPYIKNPSRRQNLVKLIGSRKRPKNTAPADPDQDLSPKFVQNFRDLFCYLTLCPQGSKSIQQLLCHLNKQTGSRMILAWIFGKLVWILSVHGAVTEQSQVVSVVDVRISKKKKKTGQEGTITKERVMIKWQQIDTHPCQAPQVQYPKEESHQSWRFLHPTWQSLIYYRHILGCGFFLSNIIFYL